MKPFFSPERRICMVRWHEGKEVKEKRAFFHLFTTRSDVVAPSPLKGGHPGGQVTIPVAIVEFENGEVYEVEAHEVHFLDTKGLMAQYSWGEEPERDCLTCEYNENGINRPCRDCKDFDKWEAPTQ